MLIFTRGIGETLKIGGDIALTVLAISQGEAQVRVEAANTEFIYVGGVGRRLDLGAGASMSILVIKQGEVRVGIETVANVRVYRLERGNRFGLHDDKASSLSV